MEARDRILFYLFLALLCYTLAAVLSGTGAFLLFVVSGGLAELLFWLNLFRSRRGRADLE